MSRSMPSLFDFSPYRADSESYVRTIKEFAAGSPFRSATVDELVLDGEFHRRPLRPEDFDFLKFTKPVRAETISRLPSLASQRTLNSLYELTAAAPPGVNDPGRLAAFAEFSNETNRLHAARLTPFLEAYAFEYLSNDAGVGGSVADFSGRLESLYASEQEFWDRLFARLSGADYLREGLCFILVQLWCLAPSRRKALALAAARGCLDGWPEGSAPQLSWRRLNDRVFRDLAQMLGIGRQQHSYWQFYLPSSLSKCNLLYALLRRPECTHALYGALFVAEAEWLAFETAVAKACGHIFGRLNIEVATESRRHVADLLRRFEVAVQFLSDRHGREAAQQLGQGLTAGGTVAERARWDLGEQLKWLSAIEDYCGYAHVISRRIENECPDIDRETFVEPRDMCSTTHVHNDHRLVTIEEGIMHFWGNIGMRLEMNPGDRVLIPEGRLHGSTVLSPQCTYHQPIIPDAWIQQLLNPTAREVAGRTPAPPSDRPPIRAASK